MLRPYSEVKFESWLSKVNDPLTEVIVWSYLLLGFCFFIVGWQMLYRLKKYFPEFYNQFGCNLWFATCVLSFPLAFRAILNALNYIDDYYNYWGEDKYKEAGYNFLLFFLGTYVPILA